jgi:hypothetical protein
MGHHGRERLGAADDKEGSLAMRLRGDTRVQVARWLRSQGRFERMVYWLHRTQHGAAPVTAYRWTMGY